MRKGLLFITVLGFALILRGLIDYLLAKPVDIKLTVSGVMILLVGIVLSRLYLARKPDK